MGARVLVAEDDDDLRRSFAMILESQGFEIDSASDGAQALALARRRRPDVVLLDLNMPVMDGYQFLREQARDPHLCEVPVIAITGQSDARPVGRVVATLRKPFDVDEFLRAVEDGCA